MSGTPDIARLSFLLDTVEREGCHLLEIMQCAQRLELPETAGTRA